MQLLVPFPITRVGVSLEITACRKLIKCVNCGLRWGTREGQASWIGNITDCMYKRIMIIAATACVRCTV